MGITARELAIMIGGECGVTTWALDTAAKLGTGEIDLGDVPKKDSCWCGAEMKCRITLFAGNDKSGLVQVSADKCRNNGEPRSFTCVFQRGKTSAP